MFAKFTYETKTEKFIEQGSYDEIIESGRGKDNTQNRFYINAYIQKAKGGYEEINTLFLLCKDELNYFLFKYYINKNPNN